MKIIKIVLFAVSMLFASAAFADKVVLVVTTAYPASGGGTQVVLHPDTMQQCDDSGKQFIKNAAPNTVVVYTCTIEGH